MKLHIWVFQNVLDCPENAFRFLFCPKEPWTFNISYMEKDSLEIQNFDFSSHKFQLMQTNGSTQVRLIYPASKIFNHSLITFHFSVCYIIAIKNMKKGDFGFNSSYGTMSVSYHRSASAREKGEYIWMWFSRSAWSEYKLVVCTSQNVKLL